MIVIRLVLYFVLSTRIHTKMLSIFLVRSSQLPARNFKTEYLCRVLVHRAQHQVFLYIQ